MKVGRVTIIASYKGDGKTSVAHWIAAEQTHGRLCGRKLRVAFISEEDPDPSIRVTPQSIAAGANQKLVFVKHRDDRWQLPRDIYNGRLVRFINRLKLDLVIFDSMQVLIPSVISGPASVASDTLDELGRIATAMKCGFLLTHHLNKTGRDFWTALGGSTVIHNRADTVMLYAKATDIVQLSGVYDEDDELPTVTRILAWAKNNAYAEDAMPSSLAFTGELVRIDNYKSSLMKTVFVDESPMSYVDVFKARLGMEHASTGTVAGKSQKETAKAFVNLFLSDGPKRSSDLKAAAALAQISERTLKRAREELNIETYQKGGEHWVKLPEIVVPDTMPNDWKSDDPDQTGSGS